MSSKTPNNPSLPFTKKSNHQAKFGSKAIATLYDILCYLSLTTHSLQNYSLTSLKGFLLISSTTLLKNTPRMTNQSIFSTHPFLPFIPTIQPIFPKYLISSLCNSKFLPQRRALDIQKGRRPRTTNNPKKGPRP